MAVRTRSLPGRRDGPLPLAAALRGLRTASSRAAAATAAILRLPGGSESGRRPAGLGAASLRASRSQRERGTGGARPSNRRRAARTGGAAARLRRSAEIGSRWPDSAPTARLARPGPAQNAVMDRRVAPPSMQSFWHQSEDGSSSRTWPVNAREEQVHLFLAGAGAL